MLHIRQRCPPAEKTDAKLVLPYELRQKSRLLAQLTSGEEVGLMLERGTILRGGDCLLAEDGRIVSVVASDEKVMQVHCQTAAELALVAYHLGNRHVPVQIGEGWLRLLVDHVLKQMVERLGATVTELDAPFEPASGAYDAHSKASEHSAVHEHAGH
jgi:urease accessory protein